MADPKPLPGTFAMPSLESYQKSLRKEYAKEGGWGGLIKSGVFDLTRGPMGYQSDDERKVASASAIVQDATAKAASVSNDPLKQRQMVLNDVVQRFNALGMTDLVAQAMPELSALNQQLEEMRKLGAEADSAAIKALRETSTLGADIEDAKLKPDATRSTIDENKAQAARNRTETAALSAEGQNYQSPDGKTAINVSKLDAKTRNALRAQGWVEVNNVQRDGASLGSKAEGEAFRTSAVDTANLVHQLADIRQLTIDQPGAWSPGGKVASAIQGVVNHVNYSLKQQGIDPGDFNAATTTTREGTSTASLLQQARIADARQQAMVLQLAYARAKAMDPGGRLSNQDVEIAMRIVSGGDVTQQIAMLDDIMNNATRSFSVRADVLGVPVSDVGRAEVQKARERYDNTRPRTSAPGTTDAEGWTTLPNGVRIRER